MNKVLTDYIEKMKDEIIHSTCEVIHIPSVFDDSAPIEAPFGKATVEALEYVLNLGKSFGFRTKNIDNMCGYIECGEGEKMVGIIGHLDVVPADNTWTFDPFHATVEDGKIYGRGTIDDKAPVIAALYAMKAVSENYTLDKRIRLILGINEENNWKCIERYKQTEEMPAIAFSPDANFPCIYAEKTIESIYLKQSYAPHSSLWIDSISTHQNALNVVPKFCEIVLGFDASMTTVPETITALIATRGYHVDVEQVDGSHMRLTSHGVAAHAAHPELGDNAIAKVIIILHELFQQFEIPLPIAEYFAKYIGNSYTGEGLGLNCKDESGSLTLNTAQFILENNMLSLGFNLRIPVTVDYNRAEEQLKKYCTNGLSVEVARIQEPLYIEKTNPLVQTLCNIFNDYNQSNMEPEAIGGGTYARAFDNCISFGPQMPGAKDMCHQSDEYISIENLLLCAKVYAEALVEL